LLDIKKNVCIAHFGTFLHKNAHFGTKNLAKTLQIFALESERQSAVNQQTKL